MTPKPRNTNNGRPDEGKGRRVLVILGGLLIFCVGLVLMLQNYSNDAIMFNTGLGLVIISVIAIIWAAIKTDRRRPNGQSRHP